VTTVREMSRLTERVADDSPTGGDWLTWARAIAQPGAIGLPEPYAVELVTRLAGELQRSASHAYPIRYEALSLVRCSGYGHVVLDVVRDIVADPHVQAIWDLMSAVGEAATPDGVAWSFELLDRDRERLVVGGALALENMGALAGHDVFWPAHLPELLKRFEAAEDDSPAYEWLSHLLRLVPRTVLVETGLRPQRRLAPGADIPDWSRTRLNRHWSDCQARAHEVTEALGLADQPVLARLLFDIAMGPHESRAATGYMLLGALRRLRRPLGDHVADLARNHPDPVVRDRSGRRLGGMLHGEHSPLVDEWLTGSPEERDRALLLAGGAGQVVPEALLRAALADGSVSPVAYAAGMAAHPALPTLAADATLSPAARGALDWWLRAGPRVTV
jgi:hypothetical protein